MSTVQLNRAFRAGEEVRGSCRMVLVAMADSASDEGYVWAKKATLARKCGLSPKSDTLRAAVAWLEERGYLTRQVNGWKGIEGQIPDGCEPNLSRLTLNEDGTPAGVGVKRSATEKGGPPPRAGSTRNPGRGSTQGSGRGSTRNPGSRSISDPSGDPTPLPPASGGPAAPQSPEAPEGQLPGLGDPPTSKDRARAKAREESPEFVRWWETRYPTEGGNRGSREKACRGWASRLRKGGTPTQIHVHTDRFLAARQLYRNLTGHEPPLMQGSTFLNGNFDMFDHDWSVDELKYWPAPGGQVWDQLLSRIDSASVLDSTNTPMPQQEYGETPLAYAYRLQAWEASLQEAP